MKSTSFFPAYYSFDSNWYSWNESSNNFILYSLKHPYFLWLELDQRMKSTSSFLLITLLTATGIHGMKA